MWYGKAADLFWLQGEKREKGKQNKSQENEENKREGIRWKSSERNRTKGVRIYEGKYLKN